MAQFTDEGEFRRGKGARQTRLGPRTQNTKRKGQRPNDIAQDTLDRELARTTGTGMDKYKRAALIAQVANLEQLRTMNMEVLAVTLLYLDSIGDNFVGNGNFSYEIIKPLIEPLLPPREVNGQFEGEADRDVYRFRLAQTVLRYATLVQANNNANRLAAEAIQPEINVSVLTYNVSRNGTVDAWTKILDVVAGYQADIIALQEVTNEFYQLLINHSGFSQNDYNWSVPIFDGLTNVELLLVARRLRPTPFDGVPLPRSQEGNPQQSNSDQKAYFATFVVNGNKYAAATATLESTVDTKCQQVAFVASVFAQLQQPDSEGELGTIGGIFMCDCGLNGGAGAEDENICIQNTGLVDVWTTFYPSADDPNFLISSATYGGNNVLARPDRIYYYGGLVPRNIQRIVNNLSPHYGLIAQFTIGNAQLVREYE